MNVIAVTACPTGIAHSQMAAENLQNAAEERGHEISVEVEGAMGTENELSDEQIANADVVVVAADTTVHTDRFGDLPVVKGTVKDAVNRADELLDDAEERAGVADSDAAAADTRESEGTGDAAGGDAEPEDESTPTDAESGAPAEDSGAGGTSDTTAPTDDASRSEREDRDGQGIIATLKSLFS